MRSSARSRRRPRRDDCSPPAGIDGGSDVVPCCLGPTSLARSMNSAWRGGLGLGAVALAAALASGSETARHGRRRLPAGLGSHVALDLAGRAPGRGDSRSESRPGCRGRPRDGECCGREVIADPARLARARPHCWARREEVPAASRARTPVTGEDRPGPMPRGVFTIADPEVVVGRPPRPRLGEASAHLRASDDRRSAASRRPRRALQRSRTRGRRRPAAAPAAGCRARLPLRARLRAG